MSLKPMGNLHGDPPSNGTSIRCFSDIVSCPSAPGLLSHSCQAGLSHANSLVSPCCSLCCRDLVVLLRALGFISKKSMVYLDVSLILFSYICRSCFDATISCGNGHAWNEAKGCSISHNGSEPDGVNAADAQTRLRVATNTLKR